MKRRESDPAESAPAADAIVHPTAPPAEELRLLHDAHVTAGNVLWTLARDGSTAQARRWIIPSGYELELLVWTGRHVEGQEDLCWSQLFPSEEALAEGAALKKRQLESSGWLEDIDTTPR